MLPDLQKIVLDKSPTRPKSTMEKSPTMIGLPKMPPNTNFKANLKHVTPNSAHKK